MAYCIHTLLLKDALSIFTVLVEQNYTFTLRKSEENLYSFYVTLLASWTHILLLKDALSIFTLLVEQNYTFTLRKSEENLLTFSLKLLAFCIHIYIVTKGYPVYIYSIGKKKTILSLWGNLKKISLLLSHTLGFLYTHTYSIGRTKIYFNFQ